MSSYLLRLTPGRAFVLFSVALIVGTLGIYLPFARPWIALLSVVSYGAALAFSQRRYFVELNGTVKDSPYFLGFILTLAALYRLFGEMASAGPNLRSDVGSLVRLIGEAILTTAVGLERFSVQCERA